MNDKVKRDTSYGQTQFAQPDTTRAYGGTYFVEGYFINQPPPLPSSYSTYSSLDSIPLGSVSGLSHTGSVRPRGMSTSGSVQSGPGSAAGDRTPVPSVRAPSVIGSVTSSVKSGGSGKPPSVASWVEETPNAPLASEAGAPSESGSIHSRQSRHSAPRAPSDAGSAHTAHTTRTSKTAQSHHSTAKAPSVTGSVRSGHTTSSRHSVQRAASIAESEKTATIGELIQRAADLNMGMSQKAPSVTDSQRSASTYKTARPAPSDAGSSHTHRSRGLSVSGSRPDPKRLRSETVTETVTETTKVMGIPVKTTKKKTTTERKL